MDFRLTNHETSPQALTFVGDEIGLMAAVYTEAIYVRALRGNSSSISGNDVWIADWVRQEPRTVETADYSSIADVLRDFHARTGEAMTEIPQAVLAAAYRCRDLAERFRLGARALELAEEIERKAAPVLLGAQTADEIAAEFQHFLHDQNP